MRLPPSSYCAPGWAQGQGTCIPPAALQRSMATMQQRMTVARTPAIYGTPAGTGLSGLFQVDPERMGADFMTGFNIATEKAAIALQERIEERMGITGGQDEVVASDPDLTTPWVPGGEMTRASATVPALPPEAAPPVQAAAVGLPPGLASGVMSGAIQGGIIGLIGSVVFVPRKLVAVTAIAALVGGIWGAAAGGTPQARP